MRPAAWSETPRTCVQVRGKANVSNINALSCKDMAGPNSELIDVHGDNVGRCRRLPQTQLTDLERHFVRRRLAEEGIALCNLLTAVHAHPDRTRPERETGGIAWALVNSARFTNSAQLAAVLEPACEHDTQ